jgi:TonB family protein
VEGQAGVAKAFRIGANLVLTKPINIEQSKGTLRVARGLLRKGEPLKPVAGAPVASTGVGTVSAPAAAPAKPVAAKPVLPTRPAVPAKPAAVAAPRPAVPAASAVPKPAAKPPLRPAAAATTTSIPAAHAPAAQHPVNSAVPATGHSAVPDDDVLEISAENSSAAPSAAALTPSAKIAALPPRTMKMPVPAISAVPAAAGTGKPAPSTSMPATLGGGAASAPAPAREAAEPHVEPSQVAAISIGNAPTETAPVPDKPAETSPSESSYVGAAPAFTFGGANLPEEKTGKSKKTFLGVAAVILVGGALYYGWTQYKTTTSQPVRLPAATKPASVAPKPPAASSIPASSTAPAMAPTDSSSQPGSQAGAGPATNPNDDDSTDATAPASTKPSGSTPSTAGKTAAPDKTGSDKTGSDKTGSDKTGSDKTVSDKTGSSKTGSAKPAGSPLVVKGGTAPTLQTAAPAADSPAPSMTGIAVAGSSAPPPNLGSSGSVPKPVLQTMKISQGVSRGLLIHQVSPVYPKTALAMRIEGSVELSTTISKTGDITHVKVVSGEAQLAKAAADAVKQWKYKPYLLNGEPVDIETAVTVNFKLPN